MLPLLSLLPFMKPVVDKLIGLIPNKDEREKARLEAEIELAKVDQQLLSTLAELDKGQLEINKIEAQSPHFFVVGWRPAIGWICSSALLWMYLLQPLIQSVLFWVGKATEPGKLDTAGILGLTATLLGVGGMRMFESLKGVERSNLKEF